MKQTISVVGAVRLPRSGRKGYCVDVLQAENNTGVETSLAPGNTSTSPNPPILSGGLGGECSCFPNNMVIQAQAQAQAETETQKRR